MLIDKGLVSVAQNEYEEAFKHFEKAHEQDVDNILVSKVFVVSLSALSF